MDGNTPHHLFVTRDNTQIEQRDQERAERKRREQLQRGDDGGGVGEVVLGNVVPRKKGEEKELKKIADGLESEPEAFDEIPGDKSEDQMRQATAEVLEGAVACTSPHFSLPLLPLLDFISD